MMGAQQGGAQLTPLPPQQTHTLFDHWFQAIAWTPAPRTQTPGGRGAGGGGVSDVIKAFMSVKPTSSLKGPCNNFHFAPDPKQPPQTTVHPPSQLTAVTTACKNADQRISCSV